MTQRPAVFVDRDGTIITERSYLADPEGVRLVPGAASALAELRAAGLALVTVTNQSGSRGGSTVRRTTGPLRPAWTASWR
jgi:D-glycero-D-manno-heptose 1,7-bisphosphate phosphatase